MGRGSGEKVELNLSELSQALIEICVLRNQLASYKMFANNVGEIMKSKDWLNSLKDEVDIGNLAYLANLIRAEFKK